MIMQRARSGSRRSWRIGLPPGLACVRVAFPTIWGKSWPGGPRLPRVDSVEIAGPGQPSVPAPGTVQPRSIGPGLLVPLTVALISFAVYVKTLLPGVAFGDWGEMATVPHVLGVAPPTGYPTYILMAWLAELVPLGSVAFRANLLSALYVTVTLATLSLISLRLGVRSVLAIAGALAMGVVGTVWAAATVSEVNPLHLMFVALIIHRALIWADRRARFDIVLGGLLIGLALGNTS